MGSRNPERGQAAAAKLQAEKLSVEPITIDVSTDESITAAGEIVASKFGRLDVLINNDGIGNDKEYVPGENSLRDVMLEAYNTNVFGAFQCLKHSSPCLRRVRFLAWCSCRARLDRLEAGLGRELANLSEHEDSDKYVGEIMRRSMRRRGPRSISVVLDSWRLT